MDRETLLGRLGALQERMRSAGIDVALLRQNADLFYFTGTVQDAHLVVPASGQPGFYVWRSYSRALEQSPLASLGLVHRLDGLGHFIRIVEQCDLRSAKVVGLEMDVLPAALFLFYRDEVWPEADFTDISPMIRKLRSVKDPHEIECIRHAAQQVKVVFEKVPELLHSCDTELELAALVEAELRRQGHCGHMRMRIWNQEMGMGQIVSGTAAVLPSWTNTPVGGKGPHPAYGMGASFREFGSSEIVSIDLGGWYQGYCCDITRPFFIGTPTEEVEEAFGVVKTLMAELESRLRPGTVAGELYDFAADFVDRAGWAECFMGTGRDRVRFVGHGLGIELDEFPFISKGSKMVLEPGMVVALEPKIVVCPFGVVGLEDTFVVMEDGCKRLTHGSHELVPVRR